MARLVTRLLLLGCLGAVAFAASLRSENDAHLNFAQANPLEAFKSWVEKHGKPYKSDLVELEKRFAVWRDNLEYILEYNAKHTSHWLGLNSLADLTHEEYKRHLGFDHSLHKQRPLKTTPFRCGPVTPLNMFSVDKRRRLGARRLRRRAQPASPFPCVDACFAPCRLRRLTARRAPAGAGRRCSACFTAHLTRVCAPPPCAGTPP